MPVATSILSARVAADEASADARALTGVLAWSVAQPAVTRGLVEGDAGAIDKLDGQVLGRLPVRDVRRAKIWRDDGTVLYSDESRLIGLKYPLDEGETDVVETGGTEAEVFGLGKPENRFETSGDGLVYTRIRSPDGIANKHIAPTARSTERTVEAYLTSIFATIGATAPTSAAQGAERHRV